MYYICDQPLIRSLIKFNVEGRILVGSTWWAANRSNRFGMFAKRALFPPLHCCNWVHYSGFVHLGQSLGSEARVFA